MNFNELSTLNISFPDKPICQRAKLDTGTSCNYKCKFCYYKNQLNIVTDFEEIKQRIDTLYDLGCRDFDLSGGESSIHPDFFKILEYLKFKNISNIENSSDIENISDSNPNKIKISMLTNGYFFSNIKNLEKAKELGLSELLFSLHSIRETHDKIVGKKGAFEKIIQAIENAKKLNMTIRINSTILNDNYKFIDNEYFNLIEKIQPLEVNFLPLNYFEDNKKNYNIDYNIILKPIKRFIDKSSIKYINVRYVPFCFMQGYEKHVVGYYQHIYDPWDWNLAYYSYKESNIENLSKLAKESRLHNYIKTKECLNCQYFNICDGFEKFVRYNINPVKGFKFTNVLHFRENFYNS